MADYKDQNDGMLHTRYTELMRCTPGQVERVVAERLGIIGKYSGDHMEFGSDRHEMWEEESKTTKQIPECFQIDWPISHVEEEFASAVLPGVVLHSRPDAVCAAVQTIVDYKTLIADSYAEGVRLALERYDKSKQLAVYAYQAGLHGIRIKRTAYLIEIWDRQRENILGYYYIIKDFKMSDIASVLPWMEERAPLLAAVLEMNEAKVSA